MQYRYSSRFSLWPPAPVVTIQVAASAQSRQVAVPALIDSGADGVMLPVSVHQNLGLASADPALVQGAVGPMLAMPAFQAYISLEQGQPLKTEVTLWQNPYAILGRDIINDFVVTLDGPNLTLTISQ